VLLRHMMLYVTKDEYTNFAIEITIASWAYFGWTDELMAYENVLHITTEAMQLALVFKDTFPKDTFISLLRALIQYCNVLSRLKHQKVDQKTICNILSKTLSFMQSIINETQHGKYDNFFECIDNMYNESDFKVSDYFHNISELFEVHFVQSKEIENETSDKVENGNLSHSASTTSEANDMFKTYQFVCSCIDNTLWWRKILRNWSSSRYKIVINWILINLLNWILSYDILTVKYWRDKMNLISYMRDEKNF